MVGSNNLCAAVAALMAGFASANVVTNTWTAPDGGSFFSTTETGALKNWTGGATDAASFQHSGVADFALADQATIKSDANLSPVIEGLVVRPVDPENVGDDPAEWPTWWLMSQNLKDVAFCQHLLGYFPLNVQSGWLVLGSNLSIATGNPDNNRAWGPIRKEGNGYVRVSSFIRNKDQGYPLEIADGKIFPMTQNALAYTDVRIIDPAGELALTNYSDKVMVGAITPHPGTPIPLTGNELQIGQMAPAVLPAEVCGTGRVTALSRTLTVTNFQPDIVYGARAARLRLDSTSATGRPFAHYTFDESLTADISGNSRDLTSEGSVERVYDEARGGYVARFAANGTIGKLNLVAANTDELTGDSDYTISLWAKAAAPCVNNYPTLASFGNGREDARIVQFRFTDASCTNLLLGHWSGRGDFSNIRPSNNPTNWNPREWHHYVAMREGKMCTVWVDGRCLTIQRDAGFELNLVKPARVQLGWLVGDDDRFFHGDIDDVRIYSHAVGSHGAICLFEGREPPQNGAAPSVGGETLQLPAGVKLAMSQGGEIQMAGDQSLAATNVSVTAGRGTLSMPHGGTLTMTGPGEYAGGTAGSNAFVKDGAETLSIGGALKHTGGTQVKGGTLKLESAALMPSCFAAYDFENDLATDRVNGFNLTTQTGVSRVYDAERGGYVASFSGTAAQKLEVKRGSPLLAGNSDYTISVWAKPAADCGDKGTLVSLGRESNFREVVFRYSGISAGTMVLTHWGEALDFTGISTVANPQGAWHHYVAVKRGAHYAVYCDGVKTWETQNARANLNLEYMKEICLGRQVNKTDRNFKGLMDDVYVFNCALDEAQIAALNDRAAPTIAAPGMKGDVAAKLPVPVASYSFETAGNFGDDSTGNHTLTQVGSGTLKQIDSPLGGKAVKFDNKNLVYLKSATLPGALPGAQPFTISAWIQTAKNDYNNSQNTTETSASMPTFVCIGNPTDGAIKYMHCYWHDSSSAHGQSEVRFYMRRAGLSAVDVHTGGALLGTREGESAHRWHHYATVYDPQAGLRFYVDGEILDAMSQSAFNSEAPGAGCCFFLGFKCNAGGKHTLFSGAMDEVKVYNAALSAGQVRDVMRADAGAVRVLPEGGDVAIDAGATLAVNGTDEKWGSVTGAGTLDVRRGVVSLVGESQFGGALTGGGVVRLDEGATLSLAQAPTGFDGVYEMAGGELALPGGCASVPGVFRPVAWDASKSVSYPGAVEIPDGTAISVDAGMKGPLVSSVGTVTICGGGSVTLPTGKTRGTWVIARGASVVDAGDVKTRWSVTNIEGKASARFAVTSSGEFTCVVAGEGTIITIR